VEISFNLLNDKSLPHKE